MRRAVVGALALALVVSGCAPLGDGRVELSPPEAADAYRSAMCRVLETDGVLDDALEADDAEAIAEAARRRALVLSTRALTISEQHAWPAGAEAVGQVDEALAQELTWVLEVADAESVADARAMTRPDPSLRAEADRATRAGLGLPSDDAMLCG